MNSRRALIFYMGECSVRRFRWALFPAALCLAVWALFRFVLFLGYVPSASMEPTIPAGSVILKAAPPSERLAAVRVPLMVLAAV